MVLTTDEKNLLREIVLDKFSVGAFSGMIFNASIQKQQQGITPNYESLIQEALAIRLLMKEMQK